MRKPVTLPLAVAERRLILFTGDVFLLNAALLLGLALAPRVRLSLTWTRIASQPEWFLVLTAVWWLAAMVLDSYDLRASADKLSGSLAALRTLLVTAVIYFFIPYVSAPLTSTRLAWALFFLLASAGLVGWRILYAAVFVQPQFRRRVLIVGAGRAGQTLLQTLHQRYHADYDVVGFVDDDPAKLGRLIDGVEVLGDRARLLDLTRRHGIGEVILAITNSQDIHGDLFQALMDCHEAGVQVVPMAHLYEQLTGRVPVEHIGQQLYALLPLQQNPLVLSYGLVRRVVDLLVSLIGLVLLLFLFPFLAVAIWLDSRGPILYTQARVGKGGRNFTLIKLRTMVPEAESLGEAVWASTNDKRVTRFGRLARKVRLDEAPQLWNVLKGEMSLIGPRPERPEFVERLQAQIPFYRSRHAVKPGITGWAQVNYHYGNSVEDALVKLQYDLYYVKHRSLYLDLLILLRTARTVLSLGGT